MAALLDRHDSETTARLEARALERMIGALCRHIERLTAEARSRGRLRCREADLQLEVYGERRTQALELLKAAAREPHETRISRLERVVEALDCSRTYFRATGLDASTAAQRLQVLPHRP